MYISDSDKAENDNFMIPGKRKEDGVPAHGDAVPVHGDAVPGGMSQGKTVPGGGMTSGRFLALLFSLMAAGLLCCALLVILVDPFFHYRGPNASFPYMVNDQLSQNPGLARNSKYDSLSLGSSVTLDYDKSWFKEIYGLDTLKLPYNGAYLKDIATAMEQADKSGNRLKTVFIAIDIMVAAADPETVKYPYPMYLYDDNPVNDVNYLFNKDVILEYILKPFINRAAATDPNEYYSNYMNMTYGREHVLAGHTFPEESGEKADPADKRDRMFRSVYENLTPMLEAHPDTRFIFYYPARSILYWIDSVRLGDFDAYMEEERALAGYLLTFDNAEVHFLHNDEEVITDLDRYTDTVHFDRDTARHVLEVMKAGTYRATKDNIEEMISGFYEIVKNRASDPAFIKSLSH